MIKERRDRLEKFVKKQLIGPGAMEYKYAFINQESLSSNSDILIAPPASIYSTAILFPMEGSLVIDGQKQEKVSPKNNNIEEDEENIELVEENPSPMFNNAIGISFVAKSIASLSNLKVSIKGRRYKKNKPKLAKTLVGVRLNESSERFKKNLPLYDSINNQIRINDGIACLNEGVNFESISKDFREEIKQKKSQLCQRITKILGFEKNKFRFLATLESFIYRELKKSKEDKLLHSLSQIEEINEFESIIKDLWRLERGVWVSEDIAEEVLFSKLPFKDFTYRTNFLYTDYTVLRNLSKSQDKFLKLSCNISLSKNRRNPSDSKIYAKIQLVNTSPEIQKSDRHYYSVVNDEVNFKCLFDTTISIIGTKNELLPYNRIEYKEKEVYNEDETTKFLYRRFKDYAIGHNCSAKWDCSGEEIKLQTTFLPVVETPDVDTIPRNLSKRVRKNQSFIPAPYISDSRCIEIKSLSTLSNLKNVDVISQLGMFSEYYLQWIESKRLKSKEHPTLIRQELKKCLEDYKRIKKNIEALKNDVKALNAFRIMNTAMFMQMWHSKNVKDEKVKQFLQKDSFKGFLKDFYQSQPDTIFGEIPVSWRPFQLAFILLNIDGIVKIQEGNTWPERNELVDLVWFPTGGGKTEAYLGIIAFTIAFRRLTLGIQGGGVAAIMRYTLRLLTLQQFQRATNLIICLELIRRWKEYDLGEEPITIGMWVGKNSMPNTRDDLEKEFKNIDSQIEQQLDKEDTFAIKTKIPFSKCPCCGTDFFSKPENYKTNILEDNYVADSIRLECRHKKCSFSHQPKRFRRPDQYALPILLSDEDIYENPPTLLFGTVDKFALLAHTTDTKYNKRFRDSRRIFGNSNCSWEPYRKDGYCPPDLIIQDELHLLSGPLGTAVALFENVIDQLCTQRINGLEVRPKIISSTATTRNTSAQIGELYNRKVNLFPKPGIDCDDSFFAFYKRAANTEDGSFKFQSKRKYIGILPTGRTQMWMQMRISALYFVHRLVYENEYLNKSIYETKNEAYPEKSIDYYYTLISYFNSKKEVGKTSSQVDTYLIKELRKIFALVARPGKFMYYFYCRNLRQVELTGRLSGPEVQKNLAIVENGFKDSQRLNGKTPPDLVIATNMIAVGLDVSRFNVILMNSMPRNIAEYIQASSRVARDESGLVFTLHHPFRSRDLSHFESFIDFHEKFYGYVEPISITPFAEKALKRYLNLYVATLLRQTTHPNNKDAYNIDEKSKHEIKNDIMDFFKNKRQTLGIGYTLPSDTISVIDKILEDALDNWFQKKSSRESLWFNNPREKENNLYIPLNEYESKIVDDFWKIPMSLRSVEPETVIRILNK